MTLKCRRIAALLVSCALLLVFLMTAEVQAKAGERIYAKALKVNIAEISVVRYGNDGPEVLDSWQEGMFGRSTGEWLYCSEPEVDFKRGYKTGVPAEKHMSEDTIRLIGAMMCWYDHNMCPGVDSTDEYLFKQEIIWNVLNMEKKWRPDCRYEHSLGEKCGSGHTLESHREELFSDGLKWAEENADQVETEATVYEGDGQMLMDLTYKWNPEGKLRLRKISADPEITDGNKCYSLAGAEYRVYKDEACTDMVGTLTTDAEGGTEAAEVDEGEYFVKEYTAPEGYALDPKVYSVTVKAGEENTLKLSDIPQSAPIDILLEKTDADTGANVPLGAATLNGAEFTVCYYPDLYTSEPSESPERTWVFATDEEGICRLDEDSLVSGDSLYTDSSGGAVLPLGTVTIRETKAPEGYLINDEVFVRQITPEGTAESVHTYNKADVPEKVIRGELQIIKIGQDEDEEAEFRKPLEGVVFEITSRTTGESVQIVTDEKGFASSEQVGNLPFDTYVVSEVITPDGYDPVEDFEITVSEEGQLFYYILEDKLVRAPIMLVKTDADTGKTIPAAGIQFQLLDSEKEPVTMTTYYPKEETVSVFTTDESGSFILPEKLPAGVYYFREVKAPEGYLLSSEDIRFEVSESYDWDEPIIVTAKNAPAMGRIRIIKSDEYTGESLCGAVFTITAAEDVVTPDGTVRVSEGTVVAEVTAGEDGIAESGLLYPGKYIIKEKKQPAGYILPEEEWTVEIRYKDQETEVVTEEKEIKNRPTVVIIDKKVTGAEQRLPGVKFAVWNKDLEDPSDPETTRKEIYTTDRDGQIRLEALEPGRYCVQETEGLPGYVADAEIHEFVVVEDGRIEGQEEYTLTVENKKTEILQTNAISVDTDGREAYPWEKTTVKDAVSLTNIQPGVEYKLLGVLTDPETGEALRNGGTEDGEILQTEYSFTGTEPEMTVDMIFEFDASAFAGRTVVVYEYLYQDDIKISEHTDPEDENQQFRIAAPVMGTTAVSPESGTHEAPAREKAVIRDKVEYKDIIPGSYILKGILMDRESGNPLLINGEKITAEKEIEISETEGTVEVDFTLDASGLNGRSVVVFEYLYRKGCDEPAASHEDIRDKGQTVIFRDKIVPETGDMSSVIPLLLLAAAGAGTAAVLLFSRREKQHKRKRNGCRHRKKKVIK